MQSPIHVAVWEPLSFGSLVRLRSPLNGGPQLPGLLAGEIQQQVSESTTRPEPNKSPAWVKP